MASLNWNKVNIRMNMKDTANNKYSESPFQVHSSKISEVLNNTGETNHIIAQTCYALGRLSTSTTLGIDVEATGSLNDYS